jgi:16S rRNA (guanine(966)-N(2))-methyltransferase RsmD
VLCKYDLPADKRVGDLFSGIGSLGVEALSRGAEFVTFVEKDPEITMILMKNIEKAGFVKRSKIVRANAFRIGAPLDFSGWKYDLVFVDPPYSTTENISFNSPLGGLLRLLQKQLVPAGIVVVRTQKNKELLEQYGRLKIRERRLWGSMAITILQFRENDK